MSSSNRSESAATTMDSKRAEARFQINASCRFWWTAVVGDCSFGCGHTLDLSVQGVSVKTPILPLLGSPIMLEVDLPPSAGTDTIDLSHLLLAAEGVVVRHHAQGIGFAARITHATFAPQKDGRIE